MSRDGRKKKKYSQNKGLKKTNRKLKIFSKGTETTPRPMTFLTVLENIKEEF